MKNIHRAVHWPLRSKEKLSYCDYMHLPPHLPH
jgi:hypothetical protein